MWSYSLLISGLFCVFMVVRYGGEKFRTEIVNQVSIVPLLLHLYIKGF